MSRVKCTCTFGVSRTCPSHANKKRKRPDVTAPTTTINASIDTNTFTSRLHEIAHGSNDKCVYGGIGCPIRRDLRLEVDRYLRG